MRFPARELKPYAEPVVATGLRKGEIYFSAQFIDEEMLVPTVTPLVFLGKNLTPGDRDALYFQDAEACRAGVRFESKKDRGTFQVASSTGVKHIFEYERALDVLMSCALQRRKRTKQK